jgi:ABC-2 family transporter protein
LQAGADREGEKALAQVIGDLAHRYRHFIGHGEPLPGTRLWRVLLVFLVHGGPAG